MIPLRVDIARLTAAVSNTLLIALNLVVFMYEVSLSPRAGQSFIYSFGLVPAHAHLSMGLTPTFVPMLTSMFLHGGWMHLLGNMLFLWVFGGSVEDRLGHLGYLFFYLICGVGAAVVHVLVNWNSGIPTVGGSGAISGVMGAYIVLFPRSRVTTLIPALLLFLTVRIPAVLMLGYWFFIQVFSGVASLGMPGQGGVAWWAHIGGFLLGAFVAMITRIRR